MTTKTVTVEGEEFAFEARGVDHVGVTEFEYADSGKAPSEAKQALVDALGTGETFAS